MEKAARGTDGRIYPWGNAKPDARALCNFTITNGVPRRWDAIRRRGICPYGCVDMAGNVE